MRQTIPDVSLVVPLIIGNLYFGELPLYYADDKLAAAQFLLRNKGNYPPISSLAIRLLHRGRPFLKITQGSSIANQVPNQRLKLAIWKQGITLHIDFFYREILDLRG